MLRFHNFFSLQVMFASAGNICIVSNVIVAIVAVQNVVILILCYLFVILLLPCKSFGGARPDCSHRCFKLLSLLRDFIANSLRHWALLQSSSLHMFGLVPRSFGDFVIVQGYSKFRPHQGFLSLGCVGYRTQCLYLRFLFQPSFRSYSFVIGISRSVIWLYQLS